MLVLRRFHGTDFARTNAIIDGLYTHLTNYVNLIGSATLPLPEVCMASALPGSGCRVEGHLGSRYFPDSFPIDEAEALAEAGIKKIFELDDNYEVNVQPHSATQANHIVWRSILSAGDLAMGLSLNDGGHISHVLGLPAGVHFEPIPVSLSGIDYEQLEDIVIKRKPKIIIVGGSSYPLAIDFPLLGAIAERVGAHLHADLAHIAPYVATGVHPKAIPYVNSVTIDTGKNLRGPKGGALIFRRDLKKKIKRTLFPLTQSSPNQSAIIAKACLFEYWTNNDLQHYAQKLMDTGKMLASALLSNGIPVIYERTESHLIMLKVSALGHTGKEAEDSLSKSMILANRNSIPGDLRSASIASGLRLGTTVLTVLDYERSDIEYLASVIGEILINKIDGKDLISPLLAKYHEPYIKFEI